MVKAHVAEVPLSMDMARRDLALAPLPGSSLFMAAAGSRSVSANAGWPAGQFSEVEAYLNN